MTPKIQDIVSKFVADLTKAIQAEGAAAFAAAIGGETGNGVRVASDHQVGNGRRKPGPKPKAVAGTRAKGAKRDPQVIETQTKTLLAAIKKSPGKRIEEISKVIGISTKDLALPVAKLFEARAIKTTGQRRATAYFPK